MPNSPLRYIIVAPSFDEDIGGIIFQHELVHLLRSLGQDAYLWPQGPIYKQGRISRLKRWLKPPVYRVNPELDTPVARKDELNDDAVVIYSEITLGNPLGAKNVVRWLLYKPGELHPYDFTEGEMFFRVFGKADMPELTGGAPDLFMWKVNRSYHNENRTDREGTCYIVRKGHRKLRIPETETNDAICIDGLSHAEINDIFNRCTVFYSYDEATMYTQFATICGCLSIVIPGEHKTHEDWTQSHELGRYGAAYGTSESEISHARATRDEMIEFLDQKERSGAETVKRFIALTQERFAREPNA